MFSHSGTLFLTALSLSIANAAEPAWEPVRPILEKYCFDCHGGKRTRGGVNLKQLAEDPQVAGNFELWEKVAETIHGGDMPPEDDPQPATADKELITKWLGVSLEAAARENAGDPGPVTLRRLTNPEYDNTVRALTGIDFGLSKEFLPDGGGGEGFSNVGDTLFVSPQQIDKYLAAARKLTEHAAILPGRGIMFQETRVGLRGPLQLKDQAEQALYIWYQRMAESIIPKDDEDMREADYMTAAWKFRHKEKTGATSLDQLAKEMGLSTAFLANWWEMLNNDLPKSRFLDLTRLAWRDLPGPEDAAPTAVPAAVASKIAAIQAERRSWTNTDPNAGWVRTQRRQQDSDGLRAYEVSTPIKKGQPIKIVVGDTGDGNRGDLILIEKIALHRDGKYENYVTWLKRRIEGNDKLLKSLEGKPESEGQIAQLRKFQDEAKKVLARFGKHPDGKSLEPTMLALHAPTVLSLPFGEEARVFVKGRLDLSGADIDFATAQFTATADATPDPTKIIPGALILWKRQTDAARSTMGDFGRMKMVFPDEYARRLEQVARNYRFKDGKSEGVYYLSDAQLNAVISPVERDRLVRMRKDWNILGPQNPDANLQKAWDESLLAHLNHFASRAWRRPVTQEEKEKLAAIYSEARGRELDRESSAREVLMRIFIAPDFIFRLEKSDDPGVHPVDAWELASRLSYFLWSGPPDDALRKAAADGSLLKPEVLKSHTKRMLAGKNAAALGEEFAGQWLTFHNFSNHSAVDAEKFPEFTPELRADMHHEAKEFFSHLIRNDLPVKDILLADYTFLNERLAKHYGIPGVTGNEFRKVKVSSHHRGGVLGMGSILVKTSFPQRTSPVLRGDWLLHAILGTPTPPAPADVPPFPEASDKPMTVRERLEFHRADKACASCHDKIDPLGFALEGYDALGRFRDKDENGLAIDNIGSLKDGTTFEGIDGLRDYLSQHDREFNQVLARKLIGYALGRSVLPSDKVLIEEIASSLATSEGKFSTAVLGIVTSSQFMNRRND